MTLVFRSLPLSLNVVVTGMYYLTKPTLCKDVAQGFVATRQVLCQLDYISSLHSVDSHHKMRSVCSHLPVFPYSAPGLLTTLPYHNSQLCCICLNVTTSRESLLTAPGSQEKVPVTRCLAGSSSACGDVMRAFSSHSPLLQAPLAHCCSLGIYTSRA